MTRVVFICAGNICRSPLAERLLGQALAARGVGGIEVTSAGLEAIPGDTPVEATVRAGRRVGVDLAGHRARRLEGSLLRPDDLVLVMEERQRRSVIELAALPDESVRLLGSFADGPEEIADPGGGDDAAFTLCVAHIRAGAERVADWLAAT